MIDSLEKNKFYIQAHRGYSGLYPENTLLAFEKALEAGADIIEFDIHISKDNEVFVIHDEELDRTTDGSGLIGEHTAAEIKNLDAGSWFSQEFAGEKIPTLAEVIDLIQGRAIINVEIKAWPSGYKKWRETLAAACNIIESQNAWQDTMFISFDLQALIAAQNYKPSVFTGFIDPREGEELVKLDLLQFLDINGWHPFSKMVTKNLVKEAQKRGLYVITGAGKSKDNIKKEVIDRVELGVNGISTNYPTQAREIAEEVDKYE
ncbi:MAG: glycerophosphodiester phosphodiesterase [Bacillota bacterium]